MKPKGNEYNWREALDVVADFRAAPPTSAVSHNRFTWDNVVKIIAEQEGENDGASWLCVGQLDDGRYFFLTAWCDYTGWGCQDGGTIFIANTQSELLQFGLDADERAKLGLSLVR